MVEGARLESVYTVCAVSGVRIPISPPGINDLEGSFFVFVWSHLLMLK